MKRLWLVITCAVFLHGISFPGPSWTGEGAVQVEILPEFTTAVPGTSIDIALQFTIAPGWHLYWKNPGDSGLPPEIIWDLPEGSRISETSRDIPAIYVHPPLTDYIHEESLTIRYALELPAGLSLPGESRIGASISWLVCQDVCIQGKGTVETLMQHSREPTLNPEWERRILNADTRIPAQLPSHPLLLEATPAFIALGLTGKDLPVANQTFEYFFPLHGDWMDPSAPLQFIPEGQGFRLILPRIPGRPLPDPIRGILTFHAPDAPASRTGFELLVPLGDASR